MKLPTLGLSLGSSLVIKWNAERHPELPALEAEGHILLWDGDDAVRPRSPPSRPSPPRSPPSPRPRVAPSPPLATPSADNAGTAHFSGIVDEKLVPIDIRRAR